MNLVNLLYVASMPVVKVLLITALGLFLALDSINILGEASRKYLNEVVFYVFNPALVASNLAKTVTFQSFLTLWFMPVNVFLTFVIGSALGWVLVKLTKAPKHLHGLIIGSCSAGNLGNLPIIIVPAICEESGSPFGASDVCQTYGLAYASLSMALGAVFLWSYVYNIVRISSKGVVDNVAGDFSEVSDECDEVIAVNYSEPLLHSSEISATIPVNQVMISSSKSLLKTPLSYRIQQCIRNFLKKINLKALLAPSTTGAIVGFMIGMLPPIRKLLIGTDAPLHVVEDSAYLIGEAAIPTITLIVGANLLQGLKRSDIQLRNVFGIAAVRYILLPLFGILIVKGAVHFGLVQSDPLFQFVLLLQYALPPAMNIGTITQLFGAGQTECSVIMLWTYTLASVSLTLWSTFFLWLVAS